VLEARASRDAAREDLESTRTELRSSQEELSHLRSEQDATQAQLTTTRSERDGLRKELETAQTDAEGTEKELETVRGERDRAQEEVVSARAEVKGTRAELEEAKADAQAAREASEEAEQKLVEMGDVERRVLEAHTTLEKIRNDFELEREGYAATERDLRARIATEGERQEQLEAAQAALHEHVDALRAQNEQLLEAYANAKRLSAQLAREAGELASGFEQPVAEVPPLGKIKAAAKDSAERAGESASEDEEDDATDRELRAASGQRAKA